MMAAAEGARAEPRQDRGPRNAEPRNRGERPDRGNRPERTERGEPRGDVRTDERPEGNGQGRNDGRSERPQRQDRQDRPNQPPHPSTGEAQDSAQLNAAVMPQGDAQPGNMEPMADAGAPGEGERNGNREKRSRDRYGRDRNRGERGDRGPRHDAPSDMNDNAPGAAPALMGAAEAVAPMAVPAVAIIPTAAVAPVASMAPAAPVVQAPAPVARVAPIAAPAPQVTAPAPATTGLPRVSAFVLPMADLNQVANGSGLQWVNSDTAKIAAVQAAIAAEPKPAHVTRVRPAPVAVTEGPLVLVETRRDLSQLPVPTEQ